MLETQEEEATLFLNEVTIRLRVLPLKLLLPALAYRAGTQLDIAFFPGEQQRLVKAWASLRSLQG